MSSFGEHAKFGRFIFHKGDKRIRLIEVEGGSRVGTEWFGIMLIRSADPSI
jgi:hypothetical protein